jgi:predicted transglutaminase-like cysteine proteinase
VRFCYYYSEQCEPYEEISQTRSFADLRSVNNHVNRSITPQIDLDPDIWSFGVTVGDCEEYAIQKRADLVSLGWPTRDLRLAIAQIPDGRYHMVLLATFEGTDYILDNLTSRITQVHRSRYRFMMIQSREDPRAWYRITRN